METIEPTTYCNKLQAIIKNSKGFYLSHSKGWQYGELILNVTYYPEWDAKKTINVSTLNFKDGEEIKLYELILTLNPKYVTGALINKAKSKIETTKTLHSFVDALHAMAR